MKKVVLISCVSKKLSKKARAEDLYISPLFKMNLAYSRLLGADKTFILSAKYGLVPLDQEIDPYEKTLNTMSIHDVRNWSNDVRAALECEVDFKNDQVIFLAGERYRRFLEPFFSNVEVPMKGLGIGKQLQFLKQKTSYGK